jgi:hypothetical protein
MMMVLAGGSKIRGCFPVAESLPPIDKVVGLAERHLVIAKVARATACCRKSQGAPFYLFTKHENQTVAT